MSANERAVDWSIMVASERGLSSAWTKENTHNEIDGLSSPAVAATVAGRRAKTPFSLSGFVFGVRSTDLSSVSHAQRRN